MRTRKLTFPSFRNTLIRVHRDLFTIESFIIDDDANYQLIKVEMLVLFLEDHRFFNHNGVDWISCVREFLRMLFWRPHGGASTIDMQFVRTATGYRERTLGRKIYEMILSYLIQFRYSKTQILRSYLDSAFFGSGVFGISSASKIMFNKTPDVLSEEEASQIAAMLVYPRPTKITDKWKGRIIKRATYGLAKFGRNKQKFDKLPGR